MDLSELPLLLHFALAEQKLHACPDDMRDSDVRGAYNLLND
jgi:hypothetical protein